MNAHKSAPTQRAISPSWLAHAPVAPVAGIHRVPSSPSVVAGGVVRLIDSTTNGSKASMVCMLALNGIDGLKLFDGISSRPRFGVGINQTPIAVEYGPSPVTELSAQTCTLTPPGVLALVTSISGESIINPSLNLIR